MTSFLPRSTPGLIRPFFVRTECFKKERTSAFTNVSRSFTTGHVSRAPSTTSTSLLKSCYDVVIVGGGHNGLVAAAYLQKAGLDVCVLEKRHILGGAAVTEEIVPGFKFSRASYVLSLLRPQVLHDLELKKHGLKFLLRDPNSYTPLFDPTSKTRPKSLTLGRDSVANSKQLAQFSHKDAEIYTTYEHWLNEVVSTLEPLLDAPPVHLPSWVGDEASIASRYQNWSSLKALLKTGRQLKTNISSFYELLTAPAAKILNEWFESEPLKATLATDSVIGAMLSPEQSGSGYVLLHHVMGEIDGIKGAWAYVEGGMGAVSQSIASSARSHGANLFTNKAVKSIIVSGGKVTQGVVLDDGTEVRSKVVLSNATPKVTFIDLLEKNILSDKVRSAIEKIDYTSPVTKINVAVSKLPNFLADPNTQGNTPMPHHRATIHVNSEHMGMIHTAYLDALNGSYSKRPVVEMTIPSSLDSTLAPPGCHVVQLFTQYTPYKLADSEWTEAKKKEYCDNIFGNIEQYAPGFTASVIGVDILTPPDLEKTFGLTGGNIFHGSMSLDQLYFRRPIAHWSNYSTSLSGLYLCGSGAHPGGGVMGSAGRLAALKVLKQFKKK